jgi:hypothetical protein
MDLEDSPILASARARAEAVLAEPLHWFPVRHHSPEVARHLRATIRARRPKVLFLEAPSDATDLVPFLVDAKTKPPIALYASYRDDENVLGLAGIDSPSDEIPPKYASWYPLLSYSPEYVAIKEATAIGARVVFVDLPHHGQIRSRTERGLDAPSAEEPADDDAQPEETDATPASWEEHVVASSFYRGLAEAAGYRSWDECWDALFETPGRHDEESLRRELAYFCAAARATTPRSRLEQDGTLLREAHMWRTITNGLSGIDPSDAIVVCGGFHLFLERELAPERPLPAGTVYRTVTPFSYARTSDRDGYGAGNRAPSWYERVFRHALESPEDAVVRAMVDHVVAVLARGRRDGELLSSADAISITQHARMLASLRGRRAPTLDDVRDAIVSCCCKGSLEREGRFLSLAMAAVEVGTAVGRVTPALGRLPLVHDFYRQVEELELGEHLAKDARGKKALDLRTPADERVSIFFHRLASLEIPFVELVSSGTENTLFREVWKVQWSPKVDAELAEANLHGDSVEAAALAKLDESLVDLGQGADAITATLLRATKMDLPGIVQRLETAAGAAIDAEARVTALSRALTDLVLLEGHARRRALRTDVAEELVERCYGRACFALPWAANVPPEEHGDVVAALRAIAEVLSGARGASFDRELFVENAKTALREAQQPYLQGALSGVLTELRVQTPEELATRIRAFARARPEILVTCGDFLAGVLATSRTALLLGADALVAAIDELLVAAGWDDFMTLLPRARGAFEGLHDRARVSLADRVAVHYGLRVEAGDEIARLPTSAAAAARITALDARVAEIMTRWSFR